jgi:hypothetical protein
MAKLQQARLSRALLPTIDDKTANKIAICLEEMLISCLSPPAAYAAGLN